MTMLKRAAKLLQETFRQWGEDNATRLAAALAYYTIFSIGPLLIIVIAIAGLLGGREAAQTQAMGQVQALLGVQGRQFIQSMIESASHKSTGLTATIIGFITLSFGALGAFNELQSSLDTIWGVKLRPIKKFTERIKRFAVNRLLSFSLVLAIGFLLLASLVVSAILSAFGAYLSEIWSIPGTWLKVLNFVISFGITTFLFAMIFKLLPDVKIAWKDVWLGAAVTSVLFNLGKFLIGFYLGHSNVNNMFGAAGSLAILLIWIYYSAQILFFGAEFTKVYIEQYGSKVKLEADTVKVTEKERVKQGRPSTTP